MTALGCALLTICAVNSIDATAHWCQRQSFAADRSRHFQIQEMESES
jgi:hypothetical protein